MRTLAGTLRTTLPRSVVSSWDRVKASPLGYRLAHGAFWSLAGAVIARALGLVASIVTVRVLGGRGYGEFGTIQNTVGVFTTFGGFGLGLTATKFVAQYRESDPARAGRIMALSEVIAAVTGFFAGGLLIILAPWISTSVLEAPHLSSPLRIGALVLLFGAVNTAQLGALSGLEAFKTIAHVNLAAGLAAFPFTVAGVLLWGFSGAVWGLVAATVVSVIFSHLALRKAALKFGTGFSFRDCWQERGVLWSFSFPAVMASLLVAPVNWLCNVMTVRQPNGFHEWGIFTAAFQWRTSLLFLPNTLAAIVLPVLSQLQGHRDRARLKKVLSYNVVLIGGFTLLLALAIAAAAPAIMKTYGPDFTQGSTTLVLLAFSAVLSATIGVIGQSIASANKMWWGMLLNLLWAIALVSCAWLLISWGAQGLAWANVIAYALHLITVGAYTYWFIIRK